MRAVYSKTFIKLHTGTPVQFQCPEGFVCVVRCVTAFTSDPVFPAEYNLVDDETDATIVWGMLFRAPSVGEKTSHAIDLRFVFEYPRHIRAFGDSTVDMTVSGYQLTVD